jgi:hypothetical protein
MVMLEVLELQDLKQLVIIKDSKFTYDTVANSTITDPTIISKSLIQF